MESLRRPKWNSYAKLCHYRLGSLAAKLKPKELYVVLPLFEIFETNSWSHFSDQNIFHIPKIINIDSVVSTVFAIVYVYVSQNPNFLPKMDKNCPFPFFVKMQYLNRNWKTMTSSMLDKIVRGFLQGGYPCIISNLPMIFMLRYLTGNTFVNAMGSKIFLF